jgi:hypothetical protein
VATFSYFAWGCFAKSKSVPLPPTRCTAGLPEGTAIGVTDAAAKKAEQLLAGDEEKECGYVRRVGNREGVDWRQKEEVVAE